MMLDRFIKILNSNKKLGDWKIVKNHTISTELFYVGNLLENARKADTVTYTATIYVDQDGFRGSSSFSVHDYMSDHELEDIVSKNVYAASFVKNPYFELPKGKKADLIRSSSNIKGRECADVLEELVNAVKGILND